MSTHPEKESTPAQLAAQDDVRAGRMEWQKNLALRLKAVRQFIISHPGSTYKEVEEATGAESLHFSILQKNGLISISGDRLYLRVAGETKEQKKERLKLIKKTNARLGP